MESPTKILFVEGQDDKHVVRHIRDRARMAVPFDIQDKGGFNKLIETISTEIKAPGRMAVGILVDANDDPDARWAAVSNRLRKAGISTPRDPSRDGTIMGGTPRIGVWLMPDNRSAGEIEDFVKRMIPRNDPVQSLARQYIQSIPAEARKFPTGKRSRAELHAWLATRETPGRMGSAIGRGDLWTGGVLCKKFSGWIERLFA